MKHYVGKLMVFCLSMALAVAPLAACGSSSGTDDGPETEQASQATEQITPDAQQIASWKTLADALPFATDSTSYGYDGKTFVCVFQAGDALVRVVATSESDISDKLAQTDITSDEYAEQLKNAVGDLAIRSAEDITDGIPSQEELDALVGKTGKELVDAGYTFESYNMYGGDQTGAAFAKKYASVDFTFNTSITEKQADSDEKGEAVMGAEVLEATYVGCSNEALDPESVE